MWGGGEIDGVLRAGPGPGVNAPRAEARAEAVVQGRGSQDHLDAIEKFLVVNQLRRTLVI
jgi:hypothetical protein